MIQDLFFFCPRCKKFQSIRGKEKAHCKNCGAEIVRKGRMIGIDGEFRKSNEWFAEIRDLPIPPCTEVPDGLIPGEKCVFGENDATLSQAQLFSDWFPRKGLHAILELPEIIAGGRFIATNKRFLFKSAS